MAASGPVTAKRLCPIAQGWSVPTDLPWEGCHQPGLPRGGCVDAAKGLWPGSNNRRSTRTSHYAGVTEVVKDQGLAREFTRPRPWKGVLDHKAFP